PLGGARPLMGTARISNSLGSVRLPKNTSIFIHPASGHQREAIDSAVAAPVADPVSAEAALSRNDAGGAARHGMGLHPIAAAVRRPGMSGHGPFGLHSGSARGCGDGCPVFACGAGMEFAGFIR